MEKANQQKSYLRPIILIIVILGLIGGAAVYVRFYQTGRQKTEVEKAIKSFVFGNSAPEIKDVRITGIKFYTDKEQTLWAKFNVEPVPEGAADPAYGVMKKAGDRWQSVDFGTCCIEDNLPPDVRQGLGFK